jgi:hypothetical protein
MRFGFANAGGKRAAAPTMPRKIGVRYRYYTSSRSVEHYRTGFCPSRSLFPGSEIFEGRDGTRK